MSWDAELEAFKTRIDLREYAQAAGYVLDREKSTRSEAVMRCGPDKISISRMENGHWVYSSLKDHPADRDRGSIVDFVQRRKDLNLGEVRKELRSWANLPATSPSFGRMEPVGKDLIAVMREFSRMQSVRSHPYLENRRGIPRQTLANDYFFGGCVFLDRRGNAVFPHYDSFPERNLCGYEMKNEGFTGFAPGGKKGLWLSQYGPGFSESIVICEGAIDALSHAVLFPAWNLYVSTAGRLTTFQADLITLLVEKVEMEESDFKVIAAMDSDEAGGELIDAVLIAAERSGRKGLECYQHVPQGFKDWNEQLLASRPS